MTDAFDRWIEWRGKSPEDRLGISADVYAAAMSLPESDRSDRQAVNEAVRRHDEMRRVGRTVWLYLNDHQNGRSHAPGDPEWVKVFASIDTMDRWLKENDPEGVAWEYEVEGAQPQASIWLYARDPDSRAIGNPDWVKVFASKQTAEEWSEKNGPNGKPWEYPVEA